MADFDLDICLAEGVITDPAAAGLPDKPVDASGRLVLWVHVLAEPGFVYRGAECAVDAAFIERQVTSFATLTRGGYTPPLAVEHPDAIHDTTRLAELVELLEQGLPAGQRGGDLLALAPYTRSSPSGPRAALAAAVALAMDPDEAREAVRLGRIKYFSPGLGPVELDDGTRLAFVLKELSIVKAPHQKGAPTHVLAAEQEIAVDNETKQEEVKAMDGDLGARVTAIEGRIDKLTEAVEALVGAKAEPEVEMTESSAQLSELRAEMDATKASLAEERAARRLAEARSRFEANVWPLAAQSLRLGEQGKEATFKLYEANPEALAQMIKAQAAAQPTTPARPEDVFFTTLGEGFGPEPTPMSPEALDAEAQRLYPNDLDKQNAWYAEQRARTH